MKVLQQKMQICRATPTHRSAKREFSEKGKSVGGVLKNTLSGKSCLTV